MVLNRRRVNPELFADFTNRWRVLVLFQVFLNEIQYGLLFFRKHVRRYTEHSYGSQALVDFVP